MAHDKELIVCENWQEALAQRTTGVSEERKEAPGIRRATGSEQENDSGE